MNALSFNALRAFRSVITIEILELEGTDISFNALRAFRSVITSTPSIPPQAPHPFQCTSCFQVCDHDRYDQEWIDLNCFNALRAFRSVITCVSFSGTCACGSFQCTSCFQVCDHYRNTVSLRHLASFQCTSCFQVCDHSERRDPDYYSATVSMHFVLSGL